MIKHTCFLIFSLSLLLSPLSFPPFFSPPPFLSLSQALSPTGFTMRSPLNVSVDIILSCFQGTLCTMPCTILWGSVEGLRGTGGQPGLCYHSYLPEEGVHFSCISLSSLPSPVSIGLPSDQGSSFSNSPTQKKSHFQICTKALASNHTCLTGEAGVIFHILEMRTLMLI